MTDKAKLLELADRCEAATSEQQHEILSAVYEALATSQPHDWATLFLRYLGAGAFLDAAMSLVPEGCDAHDLLVDAAATAWNQNVEFGRASGETSKLFVAALPRFVCAAALRADRMEDGYATR